MFFLTHGVFIESPRAA